MACPWHRDPAVLLKGRPPDRSDSLSLIVVGLPEAYHLIVVRIDPPPGEYQLAAHQLQGLDHHRTVTHHEWQALTPSGDHVDGHQVQQEMPLHLTGAAGYVGELRP